ncbi:efflux transporter, outer membrane factor (OMF) lipoprotein, NodT family [Pedobacter suwonensis]|uniref:Efflux transporter, outer membrane factor (OMF) lipoprotein, NodT family n=1 Tax=Pedobacter suwonensis TaxID=332999 RepID=A0A1I0U1J8_9SPHI|nr:TolC family protein [Pedobacter suwonensis]SFA57868.1 efflux transporter, outer membrane factor (OMF) lipoprotein, NodT family [Pedobacter suwonensis]
MFKNKLYKGLGLVLICAAYTACKLPEVAQRAENRNTPVSFNGSQDTLSSASIQWRNFFTDPNLINLIDTALKNNQELNITLQDIEIAKNEIKARKGELLPNVTYGVGAGLDKVGRYTSSGAGDASTEITPGKGVPEVLPDYRFGLQANWEADIWHKLRNSKKAAINHYLSTVEGKNFVITNLIAEVANSYYELLASDNQLETVRKNIELQSNALELMKIQKQATRVNELAVRKFEAEVLSSKSLEFDIQQDIIENENKINFLLGRFPQPIIRDKSSFTDLVPATVHTGLPAQLLANRPDIKQAEYELAAAKLDVKVAKAQFYPSLGISAAIGYQAFNPSYLLRTPESLIYSLAGDLAGPLINRNAIKAEYASANAKQLQAVFDYEKAILNGYIEVANQMSKISNLQKSYDLKSKQVTALTQSIDISNDLFKAARADYFEVLMTQRDALQSKLELIETKKQQLNAVVDIYQALGGGWK